MNDRTLVKLRCNKEMLDIRTVSWTRKSPYSFSILRSELQQLEQRPQNRLISGDCGSFAVLRLTQRPGDMKMLEIRFTWLQEIGAGKVHGWQESIRLPYSPRPRSPSTGSQRASRSRCLCRRTAGFV